MYRQLQQSVKICSDYLSHRLTIVNVVTPWRAIQGQRSQSTAIKVDDGEGHQQSVNEDNSVRDTIGDRNTRSISYRRWKPHEAANLGLKSLGQPAEVLILPSRERKLPNTLSENTHARDIPNPTFYEDDSRPLSWEEIQGNLLAVRNSIVTGDGTSIKPEEWKELKRVVSKSFTREQLKKYLLEKSDTIQINEKSLETANKRTITTHIIVSVWKFVVATEQSSATQAQDASDPKADPIQKTSVAEQLKVNKIALDLALVGESRMLKDISERCQVQIDVFRDKSKIALAGEPESVRHARRVLKQRLTKAPHHKSVEFSDLLKIFTRDSTFESFLKTLMQKHSVRITRKPERLSIYSFDKTSLDVVHYELTRMARVQHRNTGYTPISCGNLSDVIKMRLYPSKLIDSIMQQQIWYRQTSKKYNQSFLSDTEWEGRFQVALTQIRQSLMQRKLPLAKDLQSFLAIRPSSLKASVVADLGQALFNAELAVPAMLQSAFATDVPLLAQILTSKYAALDVESEEQTILLRLQPEDGANKLPSFKIQMTGNDISQGLQQPLQMSHVSAEFGSAIHDVLLPLEQVDVRLTRTATLEIFNSAGSPPLPRHSSLLKNLAAIVQRAQAKGSKSKSPVHQLDLGPLLKETPKFGPAKSVKENNVTDSKTLLSEEVLQSLSAISKQQAKPFEAAYFLEPPEWLDKTIYVDPLHPGCRVEHTVSAPLVDDGTGCRQTLRIVPSEVAPSVLDSIDPSARSIAVVEQNDALEQILTAAFDLAQRLTRLSKKTNNKVEAQQS